jgi:hypothetical protein
LITDFVLLDEEKDCINRYFLQNQKSGNIFIDKIELVTLELPKLEEAPQNNPELIGWLRSENR